MPKYAFLDGEIVPFEKASFPANTHALNYGTGVFEGIRAYWSEEEKRLLLFKPREHYQRMLSNCRFMRMEFPYTPDYLCEITRELLRREGYQEDSYVRPLALKTSGKIGVRLHDLEQSFVIYTDPFGPYVQNEAGARVCVSSWRRITNNSLPPNMKITGAYVNSALIKTEAQLDGYDEGLVLNPDDTVCEGSAENFFIVRDGRLIAPPLYANILEGITRSFILELARDLRIQIEERPIARSELYKAQEVFLCGTGSQVVCVVEVDRYRVGDGKTGPVTERIRRAYFGAVKGKDPKYRGYCVEV